MTPRRPVDGGDGGPSEATSSGWRDRVKGVRAHARVSSEPAHYCAPSNNRSKTSTYFTL